MDKIRLYRIMAIAVFGVSSLAHGEPTTAPTTITQLRPYLGSYSAYIALASSNICDGNTVYRIDINQPMGKEVYASVLAAMIAGKSIAIEVAGCQGWGTPVQSVYMSP